MKSEEARAFWTPEARDETIRKALEPINAPEAIMRAIEGGQAKRTLEMRTRLLEIETSL